MLTQRKKRLKRLNNAVDCVMLRSYDKGRRKITRLALPGFADLVLQYPEKQVSEDFKMPRERFEVNGWLKFKRHLIFKFLLHIWDWLLYLNGWKHKPYYVVHRLFLKCLLLCLLNFKLTSPWETNCCLQFGLWLRKKASEKFQVVLDIPPEVRIIHWG